MMPSLCIVDHDARVLICSSLIPIDFALFLVVLNELSERSPDGDIMIKDHFVIFKPACSSVEQYA